MALFMFICGCITVLIAYSLWCAKELTIEREYESIEEKRINAIIKLQDTFISHLDKLDYTDAETKTLFEMFLKALN